MTYRLRGFGKYQVLNAKRIGDYWTHKKKLWQIIAIKQTEEEAQERLEKNKEYNKLTLQKHGLHGLNGFVHEYEYSITKRVRTRNYGEIKWIQFLVLRRKICCETS